VQAMEEREDGLFRALADPSRRRLLDRLFERDGQTHRELAAALPHKTRIAVMKHLRVLERAGSFFPSGLLGRVRCDRRL
jgi:DNA-binding transcriptional ArsR family regulator